jgi:hypothetical protein
MTAATALLLIKLFGPAALQLGGQVAGNVHQDILGQQAVQVAYYQATAAYWNAQRRCCCVKRRHR